MSYLASNGKTIALYIFSYNPHMKKVYRQGPYPVTEIRREGRITSFSPEALAEVAKKRPVALGGDGWAAQNRQAVDVPPQNAVIKPRHDTVLGPVTTAADLALIRQTRRELLPMKAKLAWLSLQRWFVQKRVERGKRRIQGR